MTEAFQFSTKLPLATLALIEELQGAGYVVHKEWANGIEMRKGRPLRGWLLTVQIFAVVACPLIVLPLFIRSIGNNVFGYRHRMLVTLDLDNAQCLLV